jgi:hypothetical protein
MVCGPVWLPAVPALVANLGFQMVGVVIAMMLVFALTSEQAF